jgi:hypothetical protein
MPNDASIEEYVKDKFKQVDTTARNKIDFVEFCKFMEEVWKFAEFDIQRVKKTQNRKKNKNDSKTNKSLN